MLGTEPRASHIRQVLYHWTRTSSPFNWSTSLGLSPHTKLVFGDGRMRSFQMTVSTSTRASAANMVQVNNTIIIKLKFLGFDIYSCNDRWLLKLHGPVFPDLHSVPISTKASAVPYGQISTSFVLHPSFSPGQCSFISNSAKNVPAFR